MLEGAFRVLGVNGHLNHFYICACFCVCLCVRIAVFSVTVFYDERVVIVAEQRPDASEEDSFQWMSRVLQVHRLQPLSSSLILNSLAEQ